jgi:hypothetical protein
MASFCSVETRLRRPLLTGGFGVICIRLNRPFKLSKSQLGQTTKKLQTHNYDFIIESLAGDIIRFCAAVFMNRFGYLRDRLFWLSAAAYSFNRLYLKFHLTALRASPFHFVWSFFHSHFDDLLLMPAALPVVLWMQRFTGLRKNDLPPSWMEMIFHLAIWSVICKVVGPFWLKIGTADPWDVLAFTFGGVAAWFWWNRSRKNHALLGHEF